LVGREAEGLRKVIVSRWRFRHWIRSLSMERIAPLHNTIVNLKMDFKHSGVSDHWTGRRSEIAFGSSPRLIGLG